MNGPCCVGKRLALSLVEIIRPIYPELLIFSAMIFETCFVITDVRCLLLADLKLGQMVSLVPGADVENEKGNAFRYSLIYEVWLLLST